MYFSCRASSPARLRARRLQHRPQPGDDLAVVGQQQLAPGRLVRRLAVRLAAAGQPGVRVRLADGLIKQLADQGGGPGIGPARPQGIEKELGVRVALQRGIRLLQDPLQGLRPQLGAVALLGDAEIHRQLRLGGILPQQLGAEGVDRRDLG